MMRRANAPLRSTVLGVVVAILSIAAVLVTIPPVAAQEMTREQEAAMMEIVSKGGEGGALFKTGRFIEAETIFREVLAQTEENFPGEALMRASSLHNVAAAVAEQGRLAEALSMAEEALQLRRDAGAGPFALGSSQSLLASILREQGRRADATTLMREAVVAVASDPNAPGDAVVKDFAQFLGMLAEDGRIEEAERVADQLLGFIEQVGEPEHVDIYWAVARLRSAEGRFAEADRNYRLAYAALTKAFPDDLTRRAILISNMASVLRQQYRQRDAEQLFRRAAEDLEKLYPEGHPALATALDGLALSIAEQNRPGEAWPIGRKALDMRLALLPKDHPLIATSLVNLGLALLRDGQPEPARDAFQSAVDRRRKAGDEVGAARAAVNLAVAQHALGDTGGGVDSLENARSVFAEALPAGHPVATTAAIDEAWLLLALGEKEKALAVAREAAEALIAARAIGGGGESDAGRRGQAADRGESRRGLGGRRRKMRDRALVKFFPAVLAVAFVLATSVAGKAAEDPVALRDEAFQAAQWALTTSAGQALSQMGARFAAGDDALGTLVRERQDLVEAWRTKDKQLLDALGRSNAEAHELSTKLRAELADIAARIKALDGELESGFPEYAELSNPKPLSIADVQKLVKPNEALILFLVTVEESYVWAIGADKATWTRVAAGAEALTESVRKLRATLDPTGSTRASESAFGEELAEGGTPFDRTSAHELYTSFIAPLAEVIDGKDSLLIVPDGAFTSLPLSVLVTQPPEGSDTDPEALRTTSWLMNSYALTTLPAVSSLKALRLFEKRAEGSEPFRGFGSPTLVGRAGAVAGDAAGGDTEVASRGVRAANAYFRGRYADVDAVRELEPLPATENELRRMAEALGADPAKALALGDAATETAVKSAGLANARILAFATHGLVTGELMGLAEPALVFTPPEKASDIDDGLLTASEAAQLNLAADWVVLSACNTAAGDGTPGAEGLSGLARAFLYAGARAILVSHWPVRDDAAAALTTTAFANLTSDPSIGRAEALRRAMLSVMENPGDPTLAHPSAWAPFVVVGEGGAG